MFRIIEETVPIPLIILNGSNNPDKIQRPFEDNPSEELVSVLAEIWKSMTDSGLSPDDAKKRLTHPRFLRLYKKIIKPGGSIHLKTDSPQLFRFTRLVIEQYGLLFVEESTDVYAGPHKPELDIKTHYEGLDIANSKKSFGLKLLKERLILLSTDGNVGNLDLSSNLGENDSGVTAVLTIPID